MDGGSCQMRLHHTVQDAPGWSKVGQSQGFHLWIHCLALGMQTWKSWPCQIIGKWKTIFSCLFTFFNCLHLHFRRASTEPTPTFGLMEATLRCTWHVNLIIKKSLTSWSKLMELILTCVTMLEKRLDSTWLLLGMDCITCQMTLLGKNNFGHFYLIFFGTSFFPFSFLF